MPRNERGVHIDAQGKKTFIPLENNPKVFSELAQKLGVSSTLGFYDVYSIDDPDLLALVPRPVHALIFTAPAAVYHRVRRCDTGSKELTYDGSGEGEAVMWFRQTIGHACGLIAFLHSISNGSAKQFVKAESPLHQLFSEALPLKPLPRAEVLYNSDALEKAHMAVAFKGDTAAPLVAEPNGHHYISFIKGTDGHFYELEGAWDGPIDRGVLSEGEDVLSEEALRLGVRRYVEASEGNLEFSMVALATRPES